MGQNLWVADEGGGPTHDIADLQETAARFGALTEPVSAGSVQDFSGLAAGEGLGDRIELVADALAAGAPGRAADLIDEVAGEMEPGNAVDRPRLLPLVYRAALAARLRRPDLGEIVVDLDRWLEAAEAAESGSGEDTEAGELFLQSLASGLAPLAGLDVAATLHYARIFMDNFPPFSRPLGDVDERATRWLAQLLDLGRTRVALRQVLRELAAAWEEGYPRAAAQLRAWVETPVPSDPTQDQPWMHALLPLARTRV